MHHLPTLMRFCNQNLPTIIMCALWCTPPQNYPYRPVTSSVLVESSRQQTSWLHRASIIFNTLITNWHTQC